jgi:hypothetical protein
MEQREQAMDCLVAFLPCANASRLPQAMTLAQVIEFKQPARPA